MKQAIVLLSGGLDSSTVLGHVLHLLDYHIVHTLSIDYGQTHSVEITAAHAVAEHYKNKYPKTFGSHRTFRLNLAQLWTGPLTGTGVIPNSTENLAKNTIVAARNSVFLSLAACFAGNIGPSDLFYGPTKEDQETYPDCRINYVKSMAKTLKLSGEITEIITPFIRMSKMAVVQQGLNLEVPFHLTHTCYRGLKPACGMCDACTKRLAAFADCKLEDPIKYAEITT